MEYYLTRMFRHEPELANPLSDAGYICIGFGDFVRDEKHIASLKNDYSLVNVKKISKECWGTCPRSLSNLSRFLSIKIGDWAIVPYWSSFYIAEILEEVKALPEILSDIPDIETNLKKKIDKFDIGFVYKVKWFKREDEKYDISRSEYADKALTARLKARQTCLLISDLEESIKSAWMAFQKNTPLNINEFFVNNLSQNLYENLTLPNSPLNPHKFELLIKNLMRSLNATVEKPSIKGDGDADIVATFESIKHIIYIQAKYYERGTTASEWAIEQIADFRDRKEINEIEEYTTGFWVISSADDFTDNAKLLAKKENVRLISGKELARLILETGLNSLES